MSQYVDQREAAKSYRPVAGSMSAGLKRAREPYRVKNALVGLALGAFAVGIWAYSISAVKQDVFDDVDEEVHAVAGAKAGLGMDVITAAKEAGLEKSVVAVPVASPSSIVLQEIGANRARGVIPQIVGNKLPWLLDPKQKTLVWGAPPVDNVGKMSLWKS